MGTMTDAATSLPVAAQARALIRTADRATLATVCPAGMADATDPGGWPYASLVLIACTQAAEPLLLISTLAQHTRNLLAEPRVSLLLDGTAGLDEPLTGARLSLLGRATRSDDPADRKRYVGRHPSAEQYAGFGDFSVWRISLDRAHLVAGFGRISWVEGTELRGPAPDALAAREDDIVGHMNDDHADAIDLYAGRLLGAEGTGWRMTGIDAEGCDLRRAGRTLRLPFGRPVDDAEQARAELVRLVKTARAGSGVGTI